MYYGWSCVLILYFLVWSNHMKLISTCVERTKQIHEEGCECCLQFSQLCGEPRTFSGVQGGVLHCTPTVTLSECPWTISRYLQELHYGYKPWFFTFTQFSLCFFGRSNTNMDIPLNSHSRGWLHSKAIRSYSPDTVLWSNTIHATGQQEWAQPAKKTLSWLCLMKHISRAQGWLGEHGGSIPTKQNSLSLVWTHHTSNMGVYFLFCWLCILV